MKKLYEKDAVWFAVLWIIVYVVGFGYADHLSVSIGIPKLITVLIGLLLSVLLYLFIRNNRLSEHFGLCSPDVRYRKFYYYIPLLLITSVNLWNGFSVDHTAVEVILYIISMCFVGFLEEIIFRGLLFKGMCLSNVTTAIIVSSITFGAGHIVNLLLGEPLLDTLLQLVYASAIGFGYTALFHASGSLLPCILSHALINSSSVFAKEPTNEAQILITVVQTIVSVGYGVWLLHEQKKSLTDNTL